MTGKRSGKTNLRIQNEKKDIIFSSAVIADNFKKKFVNFASTVEGQSTQEFKECIENIDIIDDKRFAYSTNLIKVFSMAGKLKENKKAVGIDGVLAKVLKTSKKIIDRKYKSIFVKWMVPDVSKGCKSVSLTQTV